MNLFVTGATGFIGSHFVNKAIEQDHDVVCLRRQGSQPRIDLDREPQWLTGSMEDDWTEALASIDILVHFAAHSANVPYEDLESCLYWNVTVPLQLFERARKAGVTQFLVAGTGFEYGRTGERYDYIPTTAPLEPTTTYAASKAASSIVFRQWANEHQLKLQYLRIFQVFGEGEAKSRLWPSLRKAALEGVDFSLTAGEQVRDFTHVGKVAQIFVDALSMFVKVNSGDPLVDHVSGGQPVTLKEFAEYWWKKWDAKGDLRFGEKPYREGEVMRYVPKL